MKSRNSIWLLLVALSVDSAFGVVTKTIKKTGGDFPSFAAAAVWLNSQTQPLTQDYYFEAYTGTYTEVASVDITVNTGNQVVVFEAAPGQSDTVTCWNTATFRIFQSSNANPTTNHVKIRGLTIDNIESNAAASIYFGPAARTGWRIDNCRIKQNGSTTSGTAILLGLSSVAHASDSITRCYITPRYEAAAQYGIQYEGTVSGMTGLYIADNFVGGFYAYQLRLCCHNGTKVYNNTFLMANQFNNSAACYFDSGYSTNTGDFRNNIFYVTTASSYGYCVRITNSGSLPSLTFEYNCYYNLYNNSTQIGYASGARRSFSAWRTLGFEALNHGLNADPLDSGSYDPHLRSASPCRDVGDITSPVADQPTDYEFDPRWMGSKIDIGADEYRVLPANFNLSSPTLHQTNVPLTGNLTWQQSVGAASYLVYFKAGSAPGTGDTIGRVYEPVRTFDYTPFVGPGVHYYWYVYAQNPLGTTQSTGAPWDFTTIVTHDVGCTQITAPTGTVDSATVVAPGCKVYNYGDVAESFSVRMKIGTSYNLTTAVTNLAPLTHADVTFPNWTALSRGNLPVKCSTELSSDGTPSNDKATGSVTVNAHDVGCICIVRPSGTIDPGTVVTPACSVYNYGTTPETYTALLKIGTSYTATASVSSHVPGAKLSLTFPNWTAAPPSTYPVVCSTMLAADGNRADDARHGSVTVLAPPPSAFNLLAPALHKTGAPLTGNLTWEQSAGAASYDVYLKAGGQPGPNDKIGTVNEPTRSLAYTSFVNPGVQYYWYVKAVNSGGATQSSTWDFVTLFVTDVGADSMEVPVGSFVLPSARIPPMARIRNYGAVDQGQFNVKFTVSPGSYSSTKSVQGLAAGDTCLVVFDPLTLAAGAFTARCSTMLSGDGNPANDMLTANFQGCTFDDFLDLTDGGLTVDQGSSWSRDKPTDPLWTEPPMDMVVWGIGLRDSYPNNDNSRLISPAYKATQDNPAIAFWHSYATEAGHDGGNFSYSINGSTWIRLTPSGGLAYASVVSALGDSGWSGGPSGWSQSVFTIPVTKDHQFQVRWRFRSDGSTTSSGWLLDEIAGIGCVPSSGFGGSAHRHDTTVATLNVSPNPVHGPALVSYTLLKQSRIKVRLYDATGALKAVLLDGSCNRGSHTSTMDATRLASGVYFVKIESEGDVRITKVIVE